MEELCTDFQSRSLCAKLTPIKNRFVPYVFEPGKSPPNPCYEETTMYHLLNIGSIVAAFVFAPNEPYSRNFFSNRIFAVWSVEAVVLALCVMFIQDAGFVWMMNFKSPPHVEYMLVILALGMAGGLTCFCWEVNRVSSYLYADACKVVFRFAC